MTKVLFLSVKPRYARAILEGRKTIEVRRRFPTVPAGTVVVLYASSPERAIIGTVRLKEMIRIDPSEVWSMYADDIEIDEGSLDAYLAGAPESTLLEVESRETWASPVPLSVLRKTLGFEPPQSFRYLASEQVDSLRFNLGVAPAP